VAKKSRRRFLCVDCRMDTGKIGEYYFIHTPLWLSVVGSKTGMLCVGCLEKRLGRKLRRNDFTNAWINDPRYGHKSQRLMSRLAGGDDNGRAEERPAAAARR